MHRTLIALALSAVSTLALAQEEKLPFLVQGQDTCLGTDPVRHKAHPAAQAASVAVIRRGEPDTLSEAAAWDRMRVSQGLAKETRFQSVWAVVRMQREARPRLAQLGCLPHDGMLACSVDCDGGSVRVREADGGMILHNRGLRLGGTCGSPDRVWWREGPHDKEMAIRRLDATSCGRVLDSMRPPSAKQGEPIMDRIAKGRSCFGRSYSAGHLKAHPEQNLASLHIAWNGLDPEDGSRGRAKVSISLRGGGKAEETLTCQAEGYSVQCFPKNGDGDLLLTRAAGKTLRLSMKGLEGLLDVIGGAKLGRQDDVFALAEMPCGPPTQ